MNPMKCDDVNRLSEAFLDNEIDEVTSLRIQHHLESCPTCRSTLEETRLLETSLRRIKDRAPPAPAELRRAITSDRKIVQPTPFEFRRLMTTFAPIAALIAFGFFWLSHDSSAVLASQDYVQAHRQFKVAGTSAELQSNDPTALAQWWSENSPKAPPVPESPPQGFVLQGARLNNAEGQSFASIEYRQNDGEDRVSLFWTPSDFADMDQFPVITAENENTVRCGPAGTCSVASWRGNGGVFIAVGNFPDAAIVDFANRSL